MSVTSYLNTIFESLYAIHDHTHSYYDTKKNKDFLVTIRCIQKGLIKMKKGWPPYTGRKHTKNSILIE